MRSQGREKAKMKSTAGELEYPVSTVSAKVCGKLYQQLASKKSLYKGSPAEGIPVTIEYADTLGSLDNSSRKIDCDSPVVLCLHGAPGSHKDFKHYIKHLQGTGHRVIVPNFPTYKLTTKTKVFRHSGREKAEYIKAFLAAIKLTRVDLLISHSSAVYPTVLLWEDENGPDIRAIAFLNPSGHRRIKAMRPKIVTSVFVRVYQNKLGRGIVRTFGTTVLSITGCPVRPDNMDNVILSATTMVYSKFRKLQESLEKLREAKVPMLMVISENDKLVDTEISHEMAGLIGATQENYSVYNQYSVLEKKRTSDAFPRIAVLPEGGHYSFVHHPKVIESEINSFLHFINNTEKQ